MFIMLTRAASNNFIGAHDIRPKSAMNISYELIFTIWAGKVFASWIKLSNLSNMKLGNNLCLKMLLCEHQFGGILLLIMYNTIFHGFPIDKSWKLMVLPIFSVYNHRKYWFYQHFQQFPRFSELWLWLIGFPENHGNYWFYQHFL